MAKQETLRDIVELAVLRHPGLSGHALERLAKTRGYQISYSVINGLRAGTYRSKPSKDKLDALAWLAGVKRERVFAAAGLPLPGPSFADELPDEADLLSRAQREAILGVVNAMLTSRPLHAADAPRLRIAARDTGRPSDYQRQTKAQDEAAEAGQDGGDE